MKNFLLEQRNLQNKVSDEEWNLRIDLAACYRLIAHFGWDDSIYTHISSRLSKKHEYLVNAFGLRFDEVTASNLVKVDLNGNILDDEPLFKINPAGFTIHSAIHEARDDILSIIHVHTPETIVIASQKSGLLPLSQYSMLILNTLSYHSYEGLAVNQDEKKRLQQDLGKNNFMLLANHGALTVGSTIGEALMRIYDLQKACEVQILAQISDKKYHSVPEYLIKSAKKQAATVHSKSTGGQVAWNAFLRLAYKLDPGFMK